MHTILLLILISACDPDFIDRPQLAVQTTVNFYKNEDDAIKVKWPNGVEELARIYEEVPIKHPDAQVIVDTGAL